MKRRFERAPPPDVVVVGGGPAGAAAARLLAVRGYSVWLLTCRSRTSRDLAESLPPSCGRLFDALGATDAIAEAGFPRAGGNVVAWGTEGLDVVPFPDGPGWQVRRAALARLLVNLAEEAGALVLRDATVVDCEYLGREGAGEEEGRIEVTYRRAGDRRPDSSVGYRRVRARLVLDCSGRAGVLGSRFRVQAESATTIAIAGVWTGLSQAIPGEDGFTFVESYPDGWVWSIPFDPEHHYLTVMVDPDVTPLGHASGLRSTYERQLAKPRITSRFVPDGKLIGDLAVWGATPYRSRRFFGKGFLLVGDAAAFIDPLSSYGVKRALASGWLASIAAHTAMKDPAREELALRFFESRERETVESFHHQARDFYRIGAEAYGEEFWLRRVNGVPSAGRRAGPSLGSAPFDDRTTDGMEASGAGAPDVARFQADPRVLAAFEELRSAEAVDLRPHPILDWTHGPAIEGDEVVIEPRLATPSFPKGLRYLRSVDVVHLIGLLEALRASEPTSKWGIPELFQAYEQRAPGAPLPDFLGAVSVLLAEGALLNAASPARSEAPWSRSVSGTPAATAEQGGIGA